MDRSLPDQDCTASSRNGSVSVRNSAVIKIIEVDIGIQKNALRKAEDELFFAAWKNYKNGIMLPHVE